MIRAMKVKIEKNDGLITQKRYPVLYEDCLFMGGSFLRTFISWLESVVALALLS